MTNQVQKIELKIKKILSCIGIDDKMYYRNQSNDMAATFLIVKEVFIFMVLENLRTKFNWIKG